MSSETENIISDAFDSNAFDDITMPGEEAPPPVEAAAEAQAEATEEVAADKEEATTEESEAQVAKSEEEKAAAAKALKFKAGDKEIDLAEDAVIPWKVDGQVQSITVKDLLSNYAGKVAWDKRLSEVAQQRKAVKAEQIQVEQSKAQQQALINDVYEKAKNGKPFDAVASLLKLTGANVDPRAYTKNLRDSLLAQAQALANMTDAERQAFEINEERERLRAEQAEWQQQRESEQATKALSTRIANAIQTAGVDAEKFEEAAFRFADVVKQRGGDPMTITPEQVVNHIRATNAYEISRDAIAAVEPDLVKDGFVSDSAKWEKLARLALDNPDIPKEEFIEMYREVRRAKSGQSAAKKVAKSPVATVATASAKKAVGAPKMHDYKSITADDLDW